MTRRKTERKDEDYFTNLLSEGVRPREGHNGVTKEIISHALSLISLNKPNIVNAVFCLLDNELPSLFPSHTGFLSDGATTGQIGSYVGIFLNGGRKLDREGRDYWLKPLVEAGLLDKIIYDSDSRQFVEGHLKPKSPNNAYRLSADFVILLRNFNIDQAVIFFNTNSTSQRLMFQARVIQESANLNGHGEHTALILTALRYYVPNALPGFSPLYVDDADGDRISEEEVLAMMTAGIELTLTDSYPDIVLYNPENDSLWFIEAVCSDGEVDQTKLENLQAFCARSQKRFAGATTVYSTWQAYSRRQAANLNIAMDTHVWIAQDPSRVIHVKSITTPLA